MRLGQHSLFWLSQKNPIIPGLLGRCKTGVLLQLQPLFQPGCWEAPLTKPDGKFLQRNLLKHSCQKNQCGGQIKYINYIFKTNTIGGLGQDLCQPQILCELVWLHLLSAGKHVLNCLTEKIWAILLKQVFTVALTGP